MGLGASRYLKRFESSGAAFRISVRRALTFLQTFEAYVLDGRLLKSTDFNRAMRFLSPENDVARGQGRLAQCCDLDLSARTMASDTVKGRKP